MSLKLVLALALILVYPALSFPQNIPSAGQIEKTQQDIEEERALRTELEEGKKTLIKSIVIKGVSLLTEAELKEISLPFKGHWLTQTDINLILDSITTAYKQKGYEGELPKVTYQVKGYDLEITVEEITP